MGRRRGRAVRGRSVEPPSLSIESSRRGSADHELRRRQHELEIRAGRSADRRTGPRDGGEGERRRPPVDHERGVRDAVPRQARAADRPLPRRSVRRRNGRLLSVVRLRREPRRRVDRHAAACVSSIRPRRSSASRLGHRARRERERPREARRVQQPVRTAHRVGAVAASGLRARADASKGGRGSSRLRRDRARQPRPVHLGRQRARLLRQQREDDRPDGRVRRRSRSESPNGAVRRPSRHRRDRSRVDGRGNSSVCPRRRLMRTACDRALRAIGRGARVREQRVGRTVVQPRNELSRPFRAHAHLSDVRSVGSRPAGRGRP